MGLFDWIKNRNKWVEFYVTQKNHDYMRVAGALRDRGIKVRTKSYNPSVSARDRVVVNNRERVTWYIYVLEEDLGLAYKALSR